MKVLVTITDVATVDDEFEVDGLSVADQYVTYEFNEWDEYALEAAVQVSEADDDVEVVTATIGPERTEETIRQALAKGADRAVRVWDESIAAATTLDPAVKARLLAAVAEQEDPDLVLSGVQSGDQSLGATGVTLAEHLGMAWAAVVTDIDLDREAGSATVHRELEGGVEEIVDVDLPAVLTIQSGINDPRYASLRGIRQAQQKELAVQGLEDLGLDPAAVESPLEQTALYEPEGGTETTFFEGGAESEATDLAGVLREQGVDQ